MDTFVIQRDANKLQGTLQFSLRYFTQFLISVFVWIEFLANCTYVT